MARRRLTWRNRRASAPPALPEGDDYNKHPASYPDPDMDAYKTGDPSSWAEDPHPGPYRNPMPPAMPLGGDGYNDHPAGDPRNLRHMVEKKANKCVAVAERMLGRTASVAAIEKRALSLMDLPESRIDRLLSSRSALRRQASLYEDEMMGDMMDDEEDFLMAEMMGDDDMMDDEEDFLMAEMMDDDEDMMDDEFMMDLEAARAYKKRGLGYGKGHGLSQRDYNKNYHRQYRDEVQGMSPKPERWKSAGYMDEEDLLDDMIDDEFMGHYMDDGMDEDEMLAEMMEEQEAGGGCGGDYMDEEDEALLARMLQASEDEDEDSDDDSEDEDSDDDSEDEDSDDDKGGKKASDILMTPGTDDPMGFGQDLGSDSLLDRLYRLASEDEEGEEEEKGHGKKKEEAKLHPKEKKASRGPSTLGTITRSASTQDRDVAELSKIWRSDPNVSGHFS